ncbi:MAG: carboxypeptidase regulatory-like domain-containing protein [Acidobacteriota bacterium]
MQRRWVLFILFSALVSMPALTTLARLDAGEVMGTVSDVEGRNLASAVVTLSRGDEAWEVQTDEQGLFRIGDLKPGNYTIQVAQEGYSEAVFEPVNIRLGRVTTVSVQMSETVEETIIVTSEPPAPVSRTSAGTRLSAGELATIPLASDPWSAAAREAGGVAQQGRPSPSEAASLTVAGASDRDTTFTLDGAEVTDRDQRGGPTVPLGLSSVSAVEVTIGGGDISHSTPGARINLVTRRGSNRAQASARGLLTQQDWQSSPSTEGRDGGVVATHRVTEVEELGLEASGTLLRDHLWGWGSLERREAEQEVFGVAEDTREEHAAIKLNAQLGGSSAVVAYHHGERRRSGQGAAADRALETTLTETRPSEVLRLEETHLFASDLYFTARYARVDSGTARVPLGGSEEDIVLGDDGIWRGTYGEFLYGQDAETWLLDGASYRRMGEFGHEIRFGSSYQQSRHSTSERWGQDSLLHLLGENFGTPFDIVRLERPTDFEVRQNRAAFWVQDSMTFGRLTVDAGLRHDLQRGADVAGSAGSNPLFPDLLPAVDFANDRTSIEWASLSPRVAAAYAFGQENRTVARASYSMFASRLYSDLVSRASALSDAQVFLGFEDSNQDDRFDPGEEHFVLSYNGIDPIHSAFGSPHTTDILLDPERTDELRLSVEHSFRSGFELTLDHVDREITGILETRRQIRDGFGQVRLATQQDYVLDTLYAGLLPNGNPYTVPVYGLQDGLEYTGGNLLLNGDREQHYRATTLSWARPLANQWMLRGRMTVNNWRWQLGERFVAFDDPTDLITAEGGDASVSTADSDGDVVALTAPGESLLLNSRWSFNVFALYQLAPQRDWGFDVALNVRGREGFPLPYTLSVVEGGDLREVQATPDTDTFRLDDVYLVDLRLEKELRLGPTRAALSLDVFNLLDAGYVLERERQLNSPLADQVRETLSPRSLRFGLRVALD